MAHRPSTFTDLLDMSAHGPDTWVAGSDRYPWGRVYGGQVVAQGLWAATRTVGSGYVPHSVHAYFIRGGDSEEPIRFEVDRLRDGRSFCTRRVVARQSGGAILNLSASFQRPEAAPDVTSLAPPGDLARPEACAPFDWGGFLERRPLPPVPGRARTWLRVRGPLGDDPLVHTTALAYASDDIPMEAVQRVHPLGHPWDDAERHDEVDDPYMGASLDHAVWFHRPAPADDWLLHDLRGVGVQGARGLSIGEVWTRDGLHVATIAQEVLLRERRDGGG